MRLASTKRAVSPVVGVVLLLGITLLLAAVVGTFVVGLEMNQETAEGIVDGEPTGNDATDTAGTETTDGENVIETIESEGIDTQSSEIELYVENTGDDVVSIGSFAVDATNVGSDIWIDDGNNAELSVSKAHVDADIGTEGRKEDSFRVDGTQYDVADYAEQLPEIAPDDENVELDFRAFGPDSDWVDDSATFSFAESEAAADVTVTLTTEGGSESTYYLRAD